MPPITRRTVMAGVSSFAFARTAMAQQTGTPQQGAETFPNRQIKIVCASPAGGGTDASSRAIGKYLQTIWGQPVVIENRSGGSNNIAAEAVSKAPPDGYTLLATTGNVMLVNAALFKSLNYDPAALEPVAILGNALTVLAARKDFPAKTVSELVAYAKQHPATVTYATSGAGASIHLAMELLQMRAGIKLVHVPYRGMSPAVNDLAGGHVDLMFADLGAVLQLYQGGNIRILATSERHRLKEIPDVPTLAESNLPDVRTSIFWSLMAPPKTPEAIRTKINTAVLDSLETTDMKSLYGVLRAEPMKLNIQQMSDYLKSESKLWTDVIHTANIPAE